MHLHVQVIIALTSILQHHASQSYNFEFIVNVTRSLCQINDIHTFIVFRNESYWNYEGPHLIRRLQKEFPVPLMCASENAPPEIRYRRTMFMLGNLGFVMMTSLTDKLLDKVDIAMTRLHNMRIIFILTDPETAPGAAELEVFFTWCWRVNFLNVILTYHSNDGNRNEVLTYTPFPDQVRTINLTDKQVKEYFWNKVANVQGYKFLTPVFIDEPMVLKVHDINSNRTEVTGIAGRLYTEFLHRINGTLHIMNTSNSTLHLHQKYVVQLITEREIDISIHPNTYLLPYITDGSYPIAQTKTCLIMPVVPEIDRCYYIIHAFNGRMWLIILALFVAFLVTELIANYTCDRQLLVGASVLATVAGMINKQLDVSIWKRGSNITCPRAKALLSGLVVFAGFFIANLYVAALTSLLSTTVYGRQPETVDEILATGREILLLDYQLAAYFDTKRLPQDFRKMIRLTDPNTLAYHRNMLNTSFAYIIMEDVWKMLDYQQARLWKPVFKIAEKFCVPNLFLSYPIQVDSPFYEILKTFTLNSMNAGMSIKWREMSFDEARKAGFITIMRETGQRNVVLTMEHFQMAFAMLGMCYVLCLGCWLGEHYVKWVRMNGT